MPACFQLFPIGSNEPVVLQKLDDLICEHFGVSPDPKYWFHDWYNTIGFMLAIGKGYADIREIFHDSPDILEVLTYIEERYTPNSWTEVGRR